MIKLKKQVRFIYLQKLKVYLYVKTKSTNRNVRK